MAAVWARKCPAVSLHLPLESSLGERHGRQPFASGFEILRTARSVRNLCTQAHEYQSVNGMSGGLRGAFRLLSTASITSTKSQSAKFLSSNARKFVFDGAQFHYWDAPIKDTRVNQRCPAAVPSADVESQSSDLAKVIDGKAIAAEIRKEVALGVSKLRDEVGEAPGLAVVLVGSRKDSETYVRSKKKACSEVGIQSFGVDLPEDASEDEVLEVVRNFNADPKVHGVLVQLPLPKHIRSQRVLEAISSEKDVDGFHPQNMGLLAMQGREPLFVSCTPRGCIELLLRMGIEIAGREAVVIGRSNIVGTPAALLLQRHNATVTVVHSRTPDPVAVTRRADIVIAACGQAGLVRGDWIKPGAVVIDVGINPVEDPSTKRGYRLVGDVNYEEVSRIASAITPVPGGVGPMTIAMLLQNTLLSAQRVHGKTE